MALSGSAKTSSYDGRYYQLDWTATQSITGNYSTVSWTLKCAGGSAGWYAERTLELKINGTVAYSKSSRVERRVGTIKSGTLVVNHNNSTGAASFSVSIRAAVYVETVNCTASKTFTLDVIPRLATLTIPDGTLGQQMTISVNVSNSNFTHTIVAKCGSETAETLCSKSTATSVSYTPLSLWARQNTTGDYVSIVYTISTFEGDVEIGTIEYTALCLISDSVNPTMSVSYSDPTGTLSNVGSLVRGISKLSINVVPIARGGASIVSQSISVDGLNYITPSVNTDVIKSYDSVTIDVSVTDSRGRTGTFSRTISVLDYKEPAIASMSVHRCNSDGTENDEGDYIKLVFSASVTNYSGLNNNVNYSMSYKKTSDPDSSYVTSNLQNVHNVYSVTNYSVLFFADGLFAYDVVLTITDTYATVSKATRASTAYTIMHFGSDGKSICFGGMVEEEGFSCKMPIHFLKDLVLEKDLDIKGKLYFNGTEFVPGSSGGSSGGEQSGSIVTVTRIVTEGIHIATITVDGIAYKLYAPAATELTSMEETEF